MRVLVSGGGTGGHIYPALAVLQALSSRTGGALEVLYLCGPSPVDRAILEHTGLPFQVLQVGALRGVGPVRAGLHAVRLGRAALQCRRILACFQPDVVLVTGGYVSVPAALAAAAARVPLLLYLPDAEPGWAVRLLAPLATRIALSFDVARPALRRWAHKIVVTGYPLREEFRTATPEAGRQRFGLAPDVPVVLVYGGSRAARRLNLAVEEALEELLAEAQLLHVCGEADLPRLDAAVERLPAPARARYHGFAYLHTGMAAAMAAADLAVCRAGASTLAELPATRLPAILVPYPYSGQHQERNARFLAEAGGAVIVPDHALTGARLVREVRTLLRDETRRVQMRAALARLARLDAAAALAQELHTLASKVSARGTQGMSTLL
jgi:UDP-N-acetylglucosamine--N-acetylmuramyl-(pentapeptide) pyrophosphoryl-undecaprenol N-acetylglucosamine transferase